MFACQFSFLLLFCVHTQRGLAGSHAKHLGFDVADEKLEYDIRQRRQSTTVLSCKGMAFWWCRKTAWARGQLTLGGKVCHLWLPCFRKGIILPGIGLTLTPITSTFSTLARKSSFSEPSTPASLCCLHMYVLRKPGSLSSVPLLRWRTLDVVIMQGMRDNNRNFSRTAAFICRHFVGFFVKKSSYTYHWTLKIHLIRKLELYPYTWFHPFPRRLFIHVKPSGKLSPVMSLVGDVIWTSFL